MLMQVDSQDNTELTVDVSQVIEEISSKKQEKRKKKKNSTSVDLIRAYLQEVSKIPLLTIEEEIEATWKVVHGREAEQKLSEELGIDKDLLHLLLMEKGMDVSFLLPYIAKELKRYTKEEIAYTKEAISVKNLTKRQKILLNTAIEGISARQILIKSNVRLVISIAKKYVHRGMELADLIQEGNLGLMKAVEKFDPSRGFKFSTYATWWIRQSVNRAIADQSRTIRLPVHVVETLHKMGRVVSTLQQNLNKQPTPKEIAEHMGDGWDRAKVEYMLSLLTQPVSLEEPVGEKHHLRETTVGDLIESKNVVQPTLLAEDIQLKEAIDQLLDELDFLERYILLARSGRLDGRRHTLEEIGAYAGVTRERIRQLEARALRNLKAANAQKGLNLSQFLT